MCGVANRRASYGEASVKVLKVSDDGEASGETGAPRDDLHPRPSKQSDRDEDGQELVNVPSVSHSQPSALIARNFAPL